MTHSRRLLIRARVVLPASSTGIDNGAVLVSNGLIEAVGEAGALSSAGNVETLDLGEVILMPGLINAHCHLDYTGMAGQILPTKQFTDWIKSITTLKAGWSYTEFADSWVRGARMLLQNGTTTVADIEAVPELLPEAWNATPLRVFSFLEMTGVRSRRNPLAILDDATETIDRLPSGTCLAGLSPHAPYSTTPELLRASTQRAASRGWRMTTHVAESAEEFDMFAHARGPMHDWLARNERNMEDCGLGSPVRHLHKQGALGESMLLVHVNCADEADLALIAEAGSSVVHCPLSHRFFNHPEFPFEAMRKQGINLCLGTDSLASCPARPGHPVELNLFDEMRAFLSKHPDCEAAEVLRMVTVNAAAALGMRGCVGELAPGASADCIAIPFTGPMSDVHSAVIDHRGPVPASMIRGTWAIPPTHVCT